MMIELTNQESIPYERYSLSDMLGTLCLYGTQTFPHTSGHVFSIEWKSIHVDEWLLRVLCACKWDEILLFIFGHSKIYLNMVLYIASCKTLPESLVDCSQWALTKTGRMLIFLNLKLWIQNSPCLQLSEKRSCKIFQIQIGLSMHF